MITTYAIVEYGDQWMVTRYGRAIILSATKRPITFATYADARAFVAINVRADARHGAK